MPDHFSSIAAQYAESRPSYPAALASFLARLAPGRQLAWDCGTGSGQAAVLLAAEFERVVATDLSESQLRHAVKHRRVEYRLAPERDSGLGARSCDLVAAAQAAHWFDLPAFYAEAERVLRPNGIVAVWGYARILVSPEIDAVVSAFEHQRVGRYWPRGRELATAEYRNLPFPFARLETPRLVMERQWTCAQFIGYVRTWSAVDRCRTAEGRDPVAEVAPALERLWGASTLAVRWPIHMLVGRPESARR